VDINLFARKTRQVYKKKSRSEENTLARREEKNIIKKKKNREREGYAAGESQAIPAQFLGQ